MKGFLCFFKPELILKPNLKDFGRNSKKFGHEDMEPEVTDCLVCIYMFHLCWILHLSQQPHVLRIKLIYGVHIHIPQFLFIPCSKRINHGLKTSILILLYIHRMVGMVRVGVIIECSNMSLSSKSGVHNFTVVHHLTDFVLILCFQAYHFIDWSIFLVIWLFLSFYLSLRVLILLPCISSWSVIFWQIWYDMSMTILKKKLWLTVYIIIGIMTLFHLWTHKGPYRNFFMNILCWNLWTIWKQSWQECSLYCLKQNLYFSVDQKSKMGTTENVQIYYSQKLLTWLHPNCKKIYN